MDSSILLNLLNKVFHRKKEPSTDLFSEKEFYENLNKIIHLKIKDFLLPRNQLKAIECTLSWEKIKDYIISNPENFYPVYKGVLDHYTGYIELKNLIKGFKEKNFNWEKYLVPPLTLPESLDLLTGLKKMQEKEVKIAFVVDDLSEFTGIFSFYDVIEEFFTISKKYLKIDPEGWVIVPATTKLRKIEKYLNLQIPEGDYETIAGFILYNLNRIPKEGERFSIAPLEFEILKGDDKKIEKVKIRKIL